MGGRFEAVNGKTESRYWRRASAACAAHLYCFARSHREALAWRADVLRGQKSFYYVCEQSSRRWAYRGVSARAAEHASFIGKDLAANIFQATIRGREGLGRD